MAKNLINRLQEARLEVGCIYLDDLHHSIQDQITAHASGASLMYTVFDLAVFAHISDIVQIAHQHGIPVVASNLYSIHADADIAIGFPETKVFRAIAHRFMLLVNGVASDSTVFNIAMQLHCNAEQLKKHPYTLGNIGELLDGGDIGVHIHANKEAAR